MELDDNLCLCFHVTKRKIVNYIRIEMPRAPSELAHCQGAGTGCGWCRPFLKQLWKDGQDGEKISQLPAAEEYGEARGDYIKAGKGTPPSQS